MPKTLNQYIDEVERVFGGSVGGPLSAADMVNDAGRLLVGMYPWPWLHRPSASLNLVAGQAYLTLPADFEQIIGEPTAAQTYLNSVTLTTVDHLEKLRRGIVTSGLDYFGAIEYPTQATNAVNAVGARLAIYPTPSESAANAIYLNYRAGWVELSANNVVPNIPGLVEPLFTEIVRAVARAQSKNIGVMDELEAIERSSTLKRLKTHYGQAQPNLGRPRGGRVENVYDGIQSPVRRHTTITIT